jgi:prepilin-type N-terminal cleavage/methylation domain-containing protein
MKKLSKGFTLVELIVAIALGVVILGAGVLLYKQSQDSSTYLTQRTTVQGNARAAINELSQDLNLAGYGLPIAGVVVPGAATFSCSTGSASYAYLCPATNPSFPIISGNSTITGIIPGYGAGVTLNSNKTDAITIAYVDSAPNFYIDNPADSKGNPVTAGFDAQPLLQAAVSGNSTTLTFDATNTYPGINDSKWGFKAGDLVLISNVNGQAVGEVTTAPSSASTLVLSGGDAMNLNQAFGTVGSIPNVLGFGSGTEAYNTGAGPLPATTVSRLYLVTYYVQYDPLTQSAGTNTASPRLYRMVNGDSQNNPPVPVAEQISNLVFTYNLFNSVCGGAQLANQEALASTNQIPLIKTVNANITAASTLKTMALPGQQIQQIPLSTSVSPRNLSYFDSYSSTSNGSC